METDRAAKTGSDRSPRSRTENSLIPNAKAGNAPAIASRQKTSSNVAPQNPIMRRTFCRPSQVPRIQRQSCPVVLGRSGGGKARLRPRGAASFLGMENVSIRIPVRLLIVPVPGGGVDGVVLLVFRI